MVKVQPTIISEMGSMELFHIKKHGKEHNLIFLIRVLTTGGITLRDQCTKHGKGKIVNIHPQEQKRRDIIEQTNTPEFKALYRAGAKVERKVAHVIRCGMRKSRYIGKAKTLIQLAFTSAGVNLKRLFKLFTGEVSAFASFQAALS